MRNRKARSGLERVAAGVAGSVKEGAPGKTSRRKEEV